MDAVMEVKTTTGGNYDITNLADQYIMPYEAKELH